MARICGVFFIFMLEKPYRIIGDLQSDIPAVVKIAYGPAKYAIAKCKRQSTSLKRIENALNSFLRGGVNHPHALYYHLFNYVKERPGMRFKVTPILETENTYELLKCEQEQLDMGRKNPNFLNNQVEAYIPEYDYDAKAYGWINQNAVLNFQKWLKSKKKKPRLNTKTN